MNFLESTLWSETFEAADKNDSDILKLKSAYLNMRELAGYLVSEISADLRQYTVHDITHLDALWGIASEIVGTGFSLTPTEAYVLGGAFLLHDAGMCLAAYPGGMSEIYKKPSWRTTLKQNAVDADFPTPPEISKSVIDFIRNEHAIRAQELPFLTWEAPDGTTRTLIEDGDLRHKFGNLIGTVAASHWWSPEKLARTLNKVIPAPPPFPPR